MRDNEFNTIPSKANLVLNLILISLVLIAIRIWYLSVIQYDEKFEQSRKPQRKTVIEPAKRATIRDRFNTPLAINKVAYRAAVTYSPMRQIPYSKWELNAEGKKEKRFKRKEYIHQLSELLGKELNLDPIRIEDLIYSKAALYFNIPYVLKEEISEKEYYRLKMLEKDWPGLVAQRFSKRDYPKGKTAGDLIGYMGAISREEYESNIREMKALEAYLTEWENNEQPQMLDAFKSPVEIRSRHKDLEELAYTSQDYVGKTGIEALFEQQLRGFQGRKSFYSDSKGNYLKQLPGAKEPLSGKRVLLTISHELQEFAEALLAQNEEIRQAKISGHGKKVTQFKQPWIKGGAIVALEPHTGEVLALASYPRFDPNDFIGSANPEVAREKKSRIHRWFENEEYIADIWNQIKPLERERYDRLSEKFYEESLWMDWNQYLKIMLPHQHPIVQWFEKYGTLENIIQVLNEVHDLEKEGRPIREIIRGKQDQSLQKIQFLETPYTKILFIDLCQLAVDEEAFSSELLSYIGKRTIATHRETESAFTHIQEGIKALTKELFHSTVFARWREKNEKNFLKNKRDLEKLNKSYPKPYIDYLDEKENELFAIFWGKIRYDLTLALLRGEGNNHNPFFSHFKLLHEEIENGAHTAVSWHKAYKQLQKNLNTLPSPQVKEYLSTLRDYRDLNRPLKGKYRNLRNGKNPALEKHLAAAFYPTYGYGYGRSNAYRQAATLGSIFKLVTAHETLCQVNGEALNQKKLKIECPLKVTDQIFKMGNQTYVGFSASGKPIPQLYKGGRIPRSHHSRLGEMDLVHALETSSNLYFSLLAGDVLKNPQDLAEAAKHFGLGSKTGIELPGEISGNVPKDLDTNRTGLYAMAIGQHSLVVTPLQTALMLATFANSGHVLKPHIVKMLAGASPNREEENLQSCQEENPLFTSIGIDFPLFSYSEKECQKRLIQKMAREIRYEVPMPNPLRNLLLKAMHKVVVKAQSDSLWMLSRVYEDFPEAISDYVDLKNQIVGKTSTAEQMERIDFDEEEGTNLYTHTWFGGIAFKDDVNVSLDRPELVVVVYLRFGSYGKEAAPVAAQVVNKWREIKAKHHVK